MAGGRNKKSSRFLWLIFGPLGFLLSWLASGYPELVEKYYTLAFSKALSGYLSLITGIVPFSAAEILLGLFVLIFVVSFFRILASKQRAEKFLPALYKLLVFTGILYFSFILIWGLNYNRLSFAEIAGFTAEGSSAQELEELCSKLIDRANTLRAGLPEDDRGVLNIQGNFPAVRTESSVAFTRAANIYPELGGKYGQPKFVTLSKVMSYTGITGIYIPFTGEANINIDIPESLLPATTCHELAHQRGFAREDEASYIAWVACNSSEDQTFRYSGTLSALIYSMNALYSFAPEQAASLQEKYSQEVRRDLRDYSEYWRKHEGKIEEVTSDINDAYLKSNRQEEGIQSYGRMVDLLLAEQKADPSQKFLP